MQALRGDAPGGGTLAALAFAWLAGIGVQLQQRELADSATLAALLGAALAGIATAALARRRAWRGLALPAVAALGFAWASTLAAQRLQEALPESLEGQDLELVGVVASLPRQVSAGVRFTFEVERAHRHGCPVDVPRRVSLGWYGDRAQGSTAGPGSDLEAGQRWRLTARLRAPHGQVNPHGFDFELWLFERGVRATGYVRDGAAAPPPVRLASRVGQRVERWRQRVRDAVFARVADDPRAAGVLAGLSVGDQAAIDRSDWDVFRATGTAHLVAISGLHVTMFAWGAGALVAAAWRRSARLVLWLPAPTAARWGGVGAAAAYALLAGWGVPAQRTVWMLVTAAALASLGRQWPWPLVLLAAAVAVSAVDPWALLQPGFWLSFVAVGLLMGSQPAAASNDRVASRAARLWRAVRGALRTQVVATVGLAPLTLVLFQQVSLVGFVANLVAIPVVTLVVTPLALLGAIVPAAWDLGAVVVGALSIALGSLAAWPAAVHVAAAAPWWTQLAGLLAAALLIAPLPWRLRALALPLVLPLLWPAVERPPHGRYELLVADVGQGSAVLLRTARHALLYDAGPQYSRDSDAGQRVLVPLLRSLGVRRLDALVLSHRDTDHVGGAAAVLAALPVRRVIGAVPEGAAVPVAAAARRCEAGERWRWDGVEFELLHPPADDHTRGLRPNALSCVLRVVDERGRAVLLAGDIEAAQEAALVRRVGERLRSDGLLVPHHGSRTSSSALFLDAVAPRVAWVQAGYRNRFGHPADEVLQRYAERGIEVVRSDRCGAWRWRGADDTVPTCERDRARRYWHRRF
ncbi:DNA internalization-related competence protein ComEC/Rec2 [Azohydromonas sp.]|uniref:DNA internalization-related competence protein ComEC/Rec2 n=1 Tax=Azohydromonas sp. TaxID=1872666 RepID=UPI002C02EADD|nr:DNA internalization-related competence protein ComEC/Rec2 [Azohydromonas sp.]HMM85755.1 DNA internalization-related competence protein ComEC/Rec2 [Azohydromonas sp.]